MMAFRSIKTAIVGILTPFTTVAGFKILDYKAQSLNASSIKGQNRTVQIRYNSGDFTQASQGTGQHDALFEIELLVSESASVDLSILSDEMSDDLDRATALSSAQDAARVADESMDELFDYVYQIIMDSRNKRLGLDGVVSSRQIIRFEKSDPMPGKKSVILTGVATLRVKTAEEVSGIELDEIAGTSVYTGIQTADHNEVVDSYTKTGTEVSP